MKGGVILFIVEGPSDETALMPFLTEELRKQRIRTTVKVVHGDILTDRVDRSFEVTPANVKGEIKKLITKFLNEPLIKADRIKLRDINKIYYITDTDNCFLNNSVHSQNKSACLKKMFNFNEIEMTSNKKIDFDVIFFAKNLENVIDNNPGSLTDEQKEKIATDFSIRSLKENNYFVNTFKDPGLKTWDSYRESYDGIKSYAKKACNMNNLIDEIESWKV